MSEELKAAQARIAELEDLVLSLQCKAIESDDLRAELSALKAQEPVARLPACPSRAFAVANLRDLAQSVLQHDPDVGMFRDEDQAFLINELADLAESFNGDVKLYAAPVSEAKAQGVVMLGRDAIREVFMSNGFTIKEGQADLKPYVYAAAEELLRLAAPAAPAADAGLVLEQAMYTLISIGYHENSGLVHELRQALAAHRAKGVV